MFEPTLCFLKGPLKEQFTPKSKILVLLIHLDCFSVSCRILETTAVEMSAFFWLEWSQMELSLSSFRGQKDRLHLKNSTAMSLYRSHDHLLKINHRPCWKPFHIRYFSSFHLLMDEEVKYSMLTKSQLSHSCQPFQFSWERLFFTLPSPIFLPGSQFSRISDNFFTLLTHF